MVAVALESRRVPARIRAARVKDLVDERMTHQRRHGETRM
jgi:hypothetical protein